jgi:hypothetical protein
MIKPNSKRKAMRNTYHGFKGHVLYLVVLAATMLRKRDEFIFLTRSQEKRELNENVYAVYPLRTEYEYR